MAANRLFAQEAPKIFVPPVARCDFRQGKSVRSSLCLSRLEGGGGHDYPIMYGPAVRCKRSWSSWRWAVLHQCIRPLVGARWAPGHHGNQRACDLISGQASTGHPGHQCSQAPGRPILHLFSSSRRPRRVFRVRQRGLRLALIDQAGRVAASASLAASKLRPWARTPHAMRASLLASAIASTLRCSRLLAASIQGLSP